MRQTLTATLDHRAGCTVLTLVGEIDHDTRPLLDGLLDGLPARLPQAGGPLRVDLRGVPFMDSAGLHFLVELRRRQTVGGGAAPVLLGVQEQPAGVLRLIGLDGLLGVAA
ncbi:STAS domain-containing protein [Streptomyces sp. NPDC092296]|uniref:STAS domain-containing protein n=1 Tax=Streptomyces sp. NPDC092296 TaxID=3366012 RepID=UPI00380BCFFD